MKMHVLCNTSCTGTVVVDLFGISDVQTQSQFQVQGSGEPVLVLLSPKFQITCVLYTSGIQSSSIAE